MYDYKLFNKLTVGAMNTLSIPIFEDSQCGIVEKAGNLDDIVAVLEKESEYSDKAINYLATKVKGAIVAKFYYTVLAQKISMLFEEGLA